MIDAGAYHCMEVHGGIFGQEPAPPSKRNRAAMLSLPRASAITVSAAALVAAAAAATVCFARRGAPRLRVSTASAKINTPAQAATATHRPRCGGDDEC